MCDSACISYILNSVFHVREDFTILTWKQVWSLLLPRNDDSRPSRDILSWNCKQPGCGCRVMERYLVTMDGN